MTYCIIFLPNCLGAISVIAPKKGILQRISGVVLGVKSSSDWAINDEFPPFYLAHLKGE